ncbi:hypothetical protein SAMN05421773_101563 [Streptomyces aidingensis]|uniref:Alpha/beta hydrolase family protein n=1 Tax=Streptomyces aidingensis TaxID=910347 RepID=A0A1I1F0F4_9ACTN|nr:hypothetical protein SAMN05421773_101563 [Streptomyces aidingensis]
MPAAAPAAVPPLRPGALVLLTAAVTALAAAGVLPRWPGLVHLVALPPLDLIADLRLLMAVSSGYPQFLAGLAAALALRVTVLAFLLGGARGPALRYAARYYLAVLPAALPAAGLLLGAGALLFYGLFWAGTAAVLLVTALTAAVPWAAPPRLARGCATAARHGMRLGTVGACLAALAVIGAVADVTRPAGPVLLVPVSALLTFAAARALRADPGLRAVRRLVAAVPAAGIAALALVAATGPAGPPTAPEPQEPRPGSLMLMSGVDSASGLGAILEIDPHTLGYRCGQTFYYSYAGPGDGQPRNLAMCPPTGGAPYGPGDTLRPTAELITFLEAQLTSLPRPVTLATHSQGVWITWEAAADGRLPGVSELVLTGPFPQNPVPYPPQGEPGRSRPAADVARLVAGLPRPGGTSAFEPDSPLGREWLARPRAVGRTLARPLPPGVRALGVASVFDLPLMPGGPDLPGAADACPVPVIHPNLPYATEFRRAVTAFLERRPLPDCPRWRSLVGPVFRPFAVPAVEPAGRPPAGRRRAVVSGRL